MPDSMVESVYPKDTRTLKPIWNGDALRVILGRHALVGWKNKMLGAKYVRPTREALRGAYQLLSLLNTQKVRGGSFYQRYSKEYLLNTNGNVPLATYGSLISTTSDEVNGAHPALKGIPKDVLVYALRKFFLPSIVFTIFPIVTYFRVLVFVTHYSGLFRT